MKASTKCGWREKSAPCSMGQTRRCWRLCWPTPSSTAALKRSTGAWELYSALRSGYPRREATEAAVAFLCGQWLEKYSSKSLLSFVWIYHFENLFFRTGIGIAITRRLGCVTFRWYCKQILDINYILIISFTIIGFNLTASLTACELLPKTSNSYHPMWVK